MSLSHYCKPEIKYKFCAQRLIDGYLRTVLKTKRPYISKGYKIDNNIYNFFNNKSSQYINNVQENPSNEFLKILRVKIKYIIMQEVTTECSTYRV